jgi:hypothetical protein
LGAERGSGVVFGGGYCGVLTRPTKGNFSQKFGFDGKVRKISNAKNEPTRKSAVGHFFEKLNITVEADRFISFTLPVTSVLRCV